MRLYCFIGSFAAGIIIQSLLSFPVSVSVFAAFLGAAIFIYAVSAVPREERALFFVVSLVAFGSSLGLARMFVSQIERPSVLVGLEGARIEAQGVVVTEPDVRDDYAKITVRLESAKVRGLSIAANDKIAANVPLYPAFEYGDEVALAGKLSAPENVEGSRFDYVSFLRKDDVRFVMSHAEAALVGKGRGNFAKERLFAFKRAAATKISSVVPPPQSNLIAGVLFGIKSSLGEKTLDDFKAAGLTHILVLSGYNVTLVAENAMRSLSFLPRHGGLAAGAVSIILFAVMAGGTAPVVRASIMSALSLLSRFSWRRYDAFRALSLAGFLMAVLNPMIVVYDPSFVLSFLAASSLILASPEISKRLGFVTARWGIRDMVATTVSAQLFVLPYLLYLSGSLSLVSFAANIAVLPAIPGAMLFGSLTAAAAFVSELIAFVPGLPAYALASYVLAAAKAFASLPFASIAVSIPAWLAALWYAGYGALIWRLRKAGKSAGRAQDGRIFDMSRAYEIVQ